MAITNYAGQLRANEIFTSIYNVIISQQVFSNNIAGTFSSLADSAKVDGGLYGDTKLYYATDALQTRAWLGDAEAANLLALSRPEDPKCQAVYIDQFRIVETTLDEYLSKRAWMGEGAFGQFQSVVMGWMHDTKRVYESTLYNTYIGTTESEATRAIVDVNLTDAASLTGNEKSEMETKLIGEALANLIIDMKDVSRDFNDYGFLRSYDENQLKFITNAKWLNKMQKVGLPTIFHKEGLIDKLTENVLPGRYFGHVVTKTSATADTTRFTMSGNNATIKAGIKDVRSTIETDYTVSSKTTHVFPGDVIPAGASFDTTKGVAYVEDPDIICKVTVDGSVPLMSAFEVATSFYNPKSLTTNHYLIWGYNTLQHLYNLPLITVKKA